MGEEGRHTMIKELEESRDQFVAIENIVNELCMKIASKYGLTNNMVDKIVKELLDKSNSNL